MERDCSAIALIKENEILLQHREDKEEIIAAGCWGFFGGGIEDESPEEGAKRECKEELDYDLENPKLIGVLDYENERNHGKCHIFLERYNGKKLTLLEGQDMGWFEFEEAKKLKITSPTLEGLRVIESYLNGK